MKEETIARLTSIIRFIWNFVVTPIVATSNVFIVYIADSFSSCDGVRLS